MMSEKLTIEIVAANGRYSASVRGMQAGPFEGDSVGEVLEQLERLLEQKLAPAGDELLEPEEESEAVADPDAPQLRELSVDLDAVAEAMDDRDRAVSDHYLDLETGETVFTEESFDLEGDDDEAEDEEDGALPEWQKSQQEQYRLMRSHPDRFERIPESDSHEAYRLMEDFISRVHNRSAQRRLASAIEGKGAFRRFKDALDAYPELRTKWFEYEAKKKREWAREWLDGLGIRSTWQQPDRAE